MWHLIPSQEPAGHGAGMILSGKGLFWDNTALLTAALQILQGENTKIIVPGEADGPAVTHGTGGPES